LSSDPWELFNDINFSGQLAAGVVQDYVQRYGEGPAWAQLAGMMGWGPPREHGPRISRLAELGWLSLDPPTRLGVCSGVIMKRVP
jgi:hypothetical protein